MNLFYKNLLNFKNMAIGGNGGCIVFTGIQLKFYFVSFIILLLLTRGSRGSGL
jgi:hypothetical protein